MQIEAVRQSVMGLPFDVVMLRSLRQTAKLLTTHFSTQIEGNRLSQAQVAEAVAGARFPGRERDEVEVRNYYQALEEVERLADVAGAIPESTVQKIHGLAFHGKSSSTPYRDGQNVIRDGGSGGIVYMPPEAPDVPELMADLMAWMNENLETRDLPSPIIAGLAHYQFATVHPYFDGNGRTARLLTTLILHKSGYGLKGIYSLEEHYARNLGAYYDALAVGDSQNYYMGRMEADVTGFLGYFCQGMAEAFTAVQVQALDAANRGAKDLSFLLRQLDPRQRRVLELFKGQGTATTVELANHLGLSPRTVVTLCRAWVEEGFLTLHDPSRKNRSFRLAAAIEEGL
ncbi:MAG: cell filamentation protein Fic [Planctomycetota bacterium]|nr:MAG: cell filamentation protein Fic [Planctomycetota bacterium]